MITEVTIVILGDSTVEKSSLLDSYSPEESSSHSYTTYNIVEILDIEKENNPLNVHILDISADDDAKKDRIPTYLDASCFVICFSTEDRKTFDNIKTRWVPEILKHASKNSAPWILLGIKKLETRKKNASEVNLDELTKLAQALNALHFEILPRVDEETSKTFLRSILKKLV